MKTQSVRLYYAILDGSRKAIFLRVCGSLIALYMPIEKQGDERKAPKTSIA